MLALLFALQHIGGESFGLLQALWQANRLRYTCQMYYSTIDDGSNTADYKRVFEHYSTDYKRVRQVWHDLQTAWVLGFTHE